jgi:hypothetical protein
MAADFGLIGVVPPDHLVYTLARVRVYEALPGNSDNTRDVFNWATLLGIGLSSRILSH